MTVPEKSAIKLDSFFIFNSTFGPKEGEEENKIIYYHPKTADINAQVKNVGLVEGLVQFARTFDSDAPVHTMQTLQLKYFFLEPEKEFFMVLVVRHPVVTSVRDGSPLQEHCPDDVADSVYLALLGQTYRLYRLLSGAMATETRQQLINRTAAIFDSYVPQLRLVDRDVTDIFDGVHFLPLDKLAFLQLQSCVNQLEVEHPYIRHTVLYFKEHLIWSGLGRTNMSIINNYLSMVLFPECRSGFCSAVWKDRHGPTSGIFMSTEASSSGDDADAFLSPPVVHLRKHNFTASPPGGTSSGSHDGDDSVDGEAGVADASDERVQMVMYRLQHIIVVLMVDVEVVTSLQLCRQLDSFLAERIKALSSLLGKAAKERSSTAEESDARVIYYNHCNLAMKSNLSEEEGKAGPAPAESCQLIVDLRDDALRFSPSGGAVFGRALNETWVAGRVTEDREFFSVIQQKNMNLMDVNSEMIRLCRRQFASIFFPG